MLESRKNPLSSNNVHLDTVVLIELLVTVQAPAKEAKAAEPPKQEEPKFQAFTGKKYSLKGWLSSDLHALFKSLRMHRLYLE